ncbi:MAG: glutathione S-transferase [Hyphomonadaceae bacterium JAD_PAG50586_4]|nr:MAG: glutathione S-transferase [Hyphomonadaceae bacterium JAD_PAG50586_4]
MAEIILHQYATSPYAEIVRTALGVKGLSWRRVDQPSIMPRPFLTPLTGGYRRIPVMQVGADIYCDTGVILREIDRRFPDPPLTSTYATGAVWAMRNWAERAWFAATVAIVFGARGESVPQAFIKDREALSGRPFDLNALKTAAPLMAGQWRANADIVDSQLAAAGPFLFGAQATAADLAAYLNIWFLKGGDPDAFARLTAGLAHLIGWTQRISAFGHGNPADMSAEAAFEIAVRATPESPASSVGNDAQGLTPGMRVSVMPDDYGRNPVVGEVVFVSPQEVAVRRQADGAGEVVVHFPRAGFWVTPAA